MSMTISEALQRANEAAHEADAAAQQARERRGVGDAAGVDPSSARE